MKQEFACDIDCNPLLYFSKKFLSLLLPSVFGPKFYVVGVFHAQVDSVMPSDLFYYFHCHILHTAIVFVFGLIIHLESSC